MKKQDLEGSVLSSNTFGMEADHKDEENLMKANSMGNIDNKTTQYGKILYVCFGFLVIFTAFSAQGLFIQVFEQLGYGPLGPIIQLVQAVSYALGIFAVPGIMKNWEYKNAMVFSSLGFVAVLVAGAMTVACGHDQDLPWCETFTLYSMNIAGSLLYGVTGSMIVTGGIKYQMSIARNEHKGQVMGIFMSMIALATVIGSLIPYLFLKTIGEVTYFTGCALLSCSTIALFFFARNVPKDNQDKEDNETLFQKASKILKMGWLPRMRVLVPLMFLVGWMEAAISAFQYKVIVNTDPSLDDLGKTALVTKFLVVHGVIQTCGSILAGKGADTYSRKSVIFIFHISMGIGIIATFFCYMESSELFAYVMAFFWSFGTGGARVLLTLCVEKDFGGSLEAYALPQFMAFVGVSFALIASISLADSINGFIVVMGVVFICSQISVSFYQQKTK